MNGPLCSNSERAVAQAITAVVDKIRQRPGSETPSAEIQLKAARLAGGQKISQHVTPARVFHVEGDHGRYMVVLYIHEAGPLKPTRVVDAECACPAGHAGKTCAHVIAVLASAEREGISLET